MKIRDGFVSNSSSTSFCIMGIYLSDKRGEDREIIEEKAEKNKLTFHYGPEGEGVYVGLSFDLMRDDETKEQFKNRVRVKIEEAEIEMNPKVRIITEGWYNG